jgi:DNA repair protein SbcC/Rad50
MKLILQNFRCFRDLTIEFPDKGLVLLWGHSGVGKSTLLKAIHFALFGKEQKVVTNGEKKCSVTLVLPRRTEGDEWTIFRTKNPTYLRLTTIEGSFEDEVAQQMILNRFGDHFLLTNYIAQKSVNSFFALSNADKTTFLHHLTLQQFDVDSLKNKIKSKIRDRKSALATLSGEVGTLRVMLEQEELTEEPVFPLKLITTEFDLNINIQKTLEEEHERKNRNLEKLQSLYQRENVLVKEQAKFEQSRPLLLQLKESIFQKETEVLELQRSIAEEKDTSSFQNQLNTLIHEIRKGKKYAEYLYSLDRYNSKRADLIDTLEERKKELEESLSQMSDIDSKVDITILQQQLKDLQKFRSVVSKCNEWLDSVEEDYVSSQDILSIKDILLAKQKHFHDELKEYSTTEDKQIVLEIEQKLTEVKTKLSSLEQQTKGHRLSCPGCKINVLYRENQLCMFDIQKIEKDRQALQKENQSLTQSLRQWKSTIIQKEQNSEEVKNDIRSLHGLLADIQSCPKGDFHDIHEKDIQTQIQAFIVSEERNYMYRKEWNDISSQLQNIENHPSLSKLNPNTTEDNSEISEPNGWSDTFIEDRMKKQGQIETELRELEKVNMQRKSNLQKMLTLQRDIITSKEQLSLYESYLSKEEQLREIQSEIESRREKDAKFEKRIKSADRYFSVFETYKRQQNLQSKLINAQSREKLAQRGLEKAEMLIECVEQAENVTLEHCLYQLNDETSHYMDQFFPDNDIQLQLFSYKELKNKERRSCIDIRVIQEGEQFELESSSGGEMDRMCLALFLSFNKISSKEMIMLDECLSSLHSEAVEDIIEVIKERYKDRLVLFTLHQANTGLFDTIIDVNNLRKEPKNLYTKEQADTEEVLVPKVKKTKKARKTKEVN